MPTYNRPPSGIPGFDEAMRANDAAVAQRSSEYEARTRQRVSDAKRNFWTKGALMAGGFAAAPALAGLLPASAAGGGVGGVGVTGIGGTAIGNTAATTLGGTSAPAAGLMGRLGAVFNSKGMDLGVNAGLSLLGMRGQNKANDQARKDLLSSQRETLALERQRLEQELANANLDREDARAVNAAINELKKRELDASEEQRAFDRGLIEQRETRLAPYRQISEQAMRRLASLWNIG